jgi:hypothetical protein
MKHKLKRLLVKLGLRKSDAAPPLIKAEDIAAGSYESLAYNLVNQANKEYSVTQSSGSVIDSMTTPNELTFLEVYGRDAFTGTGKIIDLGCWFGATTASLAAGLNANPKASVDDVVEAYDLFDWDDWMDPIKESIGMNVSLKSGQCFLDIVSNNLAQYGRRVRLHKQDLSNYVVPSDWRLEFLFVDAMKNWDLASAISRNFFTKLIPGGSIMVMQDFAFYDPIVATNHLVMWHLRDFFKPLHHVPYSCSLAFVTVQVPLLEDLLDYKPELFSESDVEQAYEYCLPLVQESMRSSLIVAKLCHQIQCQHQQGALRTMQQLEAIRLAPPMRETIMRSLEEPYSPPTSDWQSFVPQLKEKLYAIACL